MILQYPGILGENAGFLGRLDMGFERNGVLLHQVQKFVHQAQNVLIVSLLPFGAFEDGHNVAPGMFDRAHVITGKERAHSSAADHHHFEW